MSLSTEVPAERRVGLAAIALALATVALFRIPAFSAEESKAQSPQQPAPVSAQTVAATAEMGKLNFLVGQWRGKGWMIGPKGRLDFPQTKTVIPLMEGMVVGIEGDSMSDGEVFYRHTLVMLSYDGKAQFRVHAYGGNSSIADGYAFVKDGTLEWGFPLGHMKFRYQIHVNEKGQWIEIGDRSLDTDPTWRRWNYLELDKVR
jgi:hypothetical protein